MEPLELTYPRPWGFRIIGTHEKLIRQLVGDTLGAREYELVRSHVSASGKYVSMRLTVEVEGLAHRLFIFDRLREHEAVRLVL